MTTPSSPGSFDDCLGGQWGSVLYMCSRSWWDPLPLLYILYRFMHIPHLWQPYWSTVGQCRLNLLTMEIHDNLRSFLKFQGHAK